MADVIVKESPIASVLNSIPELILKAKQIKAGEEQQEFANKLALEQLEIQKDKASLAESNQEFERSLIEKQHGMDAGGYDNMDVADYFNNLALSEGKVNVNGGDLQWSGTTVLPSMAEGWAEYKQKVENSGKTISASDYNQFNQYWSNVINQRNTRYQSEIKKMKRLGYSDEDIEDMISDNPIFAQNISTVMDNDATSQEFYTEYLPKQPSRGLTEGMGTAGTMAVGVGAYGLGHTGLKWALNTPQGIVNQARDTFKEMYRTDQKMVTYAKQELAKAMKSGKQGDIKAAKDILKEAQKKFNLTSTEGRRQYQATVREGQKWRGFGKKGFTKPLGRLSSFGALAPMLLGGAAGMAGEFVGGEQVGAVAKGTVAGGVGLAQSMPLGQFVARRLALSAPRIATTFGIAAMADSPVVPIGDIIGAAISAGMSISVVYDAVKQWNKANR
jgi:hypothetical protein